MGVSEMKRAEPSELSVACTQRPRGLVTKVLTAQLLLLQVLVYRCS